jgi:outer membrane protein OmpA-like peptidoglycan-associated protein
VAYLIKKGIDPDRLVAKGYGERKLKNDCACEDGKGPGMDCTEEQHQVNRRTEFTVLRSDYVPKRK